MSNELIRVAERAAHAFDEFISEAVGLAIAKARETDPLTVHKEHIEPLRELRTETIGWLNSVSLHVRCSVDFEDSIHMPTLPTTEEAQDEQLYTRPAGLR